MAEIGPVETRPNLLGALAGMFASLGRYWALIIAATLVLAVAPDLISRFLIPWSTLAPSRGAQIVAGYGWRGVGLILNAYLIGLLYMSVIERARIGSELFLRALQVCWGVAFVNVLVSTAPAEVMRLVAARLFPETMPPMERARAFGVFALFSGFISMVLTGFLGLAPTLAASMRFSPTGAIAAAWRIGRGWRWRIVLAYFLSSLASALAVVILYQVAFVPRLLPPAQYQTVIYLLRLALSAIGTPIGIVFLLEVYRRAAGIGSEARATSEAFA